MKPEILKKFPKFVRLDSDYNIEYAWEIRESTAKIIRSNLIEKKLTSDRTLETEEGVFGLYQVAGSSKYLVVLLQNIDQIFPFETLANYATAPQAIIDIMASWVSKCVQFERFDLVRVNRPLRQFNFEYSIGIDIEGVIRSAYKEIIDSGLAWLLNNEKPYLVENFTAADCRFSEDISLYQTGFRSLLRIPIIFNRMVIGAILLASTEKERYQIEDAFLLHTIAQKEAQIFFLAGIQEKEEYNTLANATLLQAIARTKPSIKNTDFLDSYCETLRQLSKTERIGLFLINEKEDRYCCLVEAGKKISVLNQWLPIGNLLFREVLKSKSILAFNLADLRYQPVAEMMGQGLTAVLYVPITDQKGNIIACLETATADESAMSKKTIGMFKAASEHLSFILAQSISNLENNKEKSNYSLQPKAKNLKGKEKPQEFKEIIGSSPALLEVIEKATTAAKYDFPILLYGETGTGKELFAKAIHRLSNVAKGPFIAVNSAAIPGNLLESELFGYKEGAFTGGIRGGKKGKILLADGGTLFLDEIGEMPLDLQAKLLRVIQEKEVEPLGSEKPIPVEIRIISATNKNLKEMVKNQQFREDLYYRLNSIEIEIPPLRDRKEDIIELAESILEEVAKKSGKNSKQLSREAITALLNYDYPGNIRELQNIISRAFVFAPDETIRTEDLPEVFQKLSKNNAGNLKIMEKEELKRLLKEFKGNKTALARYLGITRTGLWKKLKRLGLQ